MRRGDPSNLKLCPRGEWEDRMLVETVLAMLTLVCHLKKVMHRGWAYFQARLAFTMAAFNVLVQWHGLPPNASASCPSRWRILVCKIPVLLLGLSETNTVVSRGMRGMWPSCAVWLPSTEYTQGGRRGNGSSTKPVLPDHAVLEPKFKITFLSLIS